MEPTSRIVVGVDDSEQSLEALDFASREAILWGAQLEVVWAWGHRDAPAPEWEVRLDPFEVQVWAQARFEKRIAEATSSDLRVVPRAVNDDPATALLDSGRRSDLLVVGARGGGGFLGLRLGSVSEKVLTHAPCPVAVVRQGTSAAEGADEAPIVVGVDGSAHSRRALEWAVEEAGRRGVSVRVVHGWEPPLVVTGTYPAAYPPLDVFEKGAQMLVDRELERVAAEDPDVGAEGRSETASGAAMLIDASRDASLVVVGTRGRGGLAGLLLGSVSSQVAHHAECPVVVVPQG